MRVNMERLLLLLGLLSLVGCSASGTADDELGGLLSVRVSVGKAIPSTAVKEYRVVVSGDGIQAPVEVVFPVGTTEGVIPSIPAGDDRRVEVIAMDQSGRAIKKGEEMTNISGGTENSVDVTLKGVPLFANLIDNSVVENNRLSLNVISDPGDVVSIGDKLGDVQGDLVNPATNEASFSLSGDEGKLAYSPHAINGGWHTFTVKSLITGYSSQVSVRLIDGGKLKPAPLAAGGQPESRVGK